MKTSYTEGPSPSFFFPLNSSRKNTLVRVSSVYLYRIVASVLVIKILLLWLFGKPATMNVVGRRREPFLTSVTVILPGFLALKVFISLENSLLKLSGKTFYRVSSLSTMRERGKRSLSASRKPHSPFVKNRQKLAFFLTNLQPEIWNTKLALNFNKEAGL